MVLRGRSTLSTLSDFIVLRFFPAPLFLYTHITPGINRLPLLFYRTSALHRYVECSNVRQMSFFVSVQRRRR